MQKTQATLFTPYDLGDIELRNRIVLAPMTRGRAVSERIPSHLMAEYYVQRASAGLIVTEATTISEQANGWVNSPGIYTVQQVEGWKLVTEAVHRKGAPVFVQLWHTGRASHSSFHNGALAVAPSAIKLTGDLIHTPEGKKPYETPRALEIDEIAYIVDDYRLAAERARAVGFDGVEIHAANGYLIDQFLQSKTNQRTDEYGGTIENRFRFLREIVRAVLQVWPSRRVGVRLSPNGGFNDMGSADFRETFLYAAEQLSSFNLGYLHVIDGLAFGFHGLGEAMTLPEFRKVYKGAIMANSGYTAESGEEAIANKNADLVAYGRPFITNPDLVERFRNGWPLTPAADVKVWSAAGEQGYTDFPPHQS